jgi:hypothetical protein
MAANHKLTGVLKGRTITGTQSAGNELRISFNDGSTMTVQTGGPASSASTGGAVKAVRQQDNQLHLDFEDGGTWEIQTAEPTASVLVRDKEHKLEYAD